MKFSFSVNLYIGSDRQGQVTYHSVFVKERTDYTCVPDGLLRYEEVRDLLRQIRRAPLSQEGVIGKFVWQV
jgi:hypothetical protein